MAKVRGARRRGLMGGARKGSGDTGARQDSRIGTSGHGARGHLIPRQVVKGRRLTAELGAHSPSPRVRTHVQCKAGALSPAASAFSFSGRRQRQSMKEEFVDGAASLHQAPMSPRAQPTAPPTQRLAQHLLRAPATGWLPSDEAKQQHAQRRWRGCSVFPQEFTSPGTYLEV